MKPEIWPHGETVFQIVVEIAQDNLDAETCEEIVDEILEEITTMCDMTGDDGDQP